MTAWKLIGSICTTNSAAGPEKLRQKAMAKSTAISLVTPALVACWCCCHAQLIVWVIIYLTSAWLLCLCNWLALNWAGAHNEKERPTQYICSIPTYDQNPLIFLSGKVHIWKLGHPPNTTPSAGAHNEKERPTQ